MWKQILSSYFSFTKKERAGIFILLSLIVLFLLLPFAYPLFIKTKQHDTAMFEKEIATLKIQQQDSTDQYAKQHFDEDHYKDYAQPNEKNYNSYKPKGELFYFDPNTASINDWQRLGIRDKTITTIQKYLSKGGHFFKAEDIGKIWGLHADEAQRLLPYIQIAAKENNYAQKSFETKKFQPPVLLYKNHPAYP